MYCKKLLQVWMVFTFSLVLVFVFLNPSSTYATSDTNVSDWFKNPNTEGNKDTTPPAAETDQTNSAAVGFSIWDYVKTIIALVFVVVLLYVVLKFLNKRNLKYQQNQIIQNLGGLSIGTQKSVQLLQVGDTLLLVGVGEDIQLLKEITDTGQKEKLLAIYNDRQEFAASSPYITELLGKLKKNSVTEENEGIQETLFSELLQKKLSTIKKQRSKEIEKWKQKENDDS